MVGNEGTAGIGSSSSGIVSNAGPLPSSDKQVVWKKTQERFDKLPDVGNFDDSV